VIRLKFDLYMRIDAARLGVYFQSFLMSTLYTGAFTELDILKKDKKLSSYK